MAVFPKLVGWLRSTDTLSKFWVADSTPTERTVFDSDGYLYQLGTKLTPTAAQLNGTSTPLTTPVITGGVTTDGVETWTASPHDYAGAAVDWTLSAAELLKPFHKPTNANAPCAAILPVSPVRPYWFFNSTGQTLTVKKTGGTGINIANGKSALVISSGSDIMRLTLDA